MLWDVGFGGILGFVGTGFGGVQGKQPTFFYMTKSNDLREGLPMLSSCMGGACRRLMRWVGWLRGLSDIMLSSRN